MKELKNKLKETKGRVTNRLSSKAIKETSSPERITNDTVAQHREQILSAAKRFKYPVQHSKKKIVIVSLAIFFGSILLFAIFAWWQLYKVQSTSTFMYRVTQIFPVPIAKVDGNHVRYSDYLTQLRSSMHYLSTQEGINFKTEDGKRQLDSLKSRAMSLTVRNAYIAKLAKEENISVSSQEIDEQVNQIIDQESFAGSEDVYKQVIRDYYDLTFSQWRNSIRQQILRNKVYASIDTEATQKANEALNRIKSGEDFAAVAKDLSDDSATKNSGGEIGVLEEGTADLSPELQNALFNLQAGQYTEIIASEQGLFILKAIDVSDSKVRTAAIFLKYSEFNSRLERLMEDGKVKPYINVEIDFQII